MSISAPTDTKNKAANISLIGVANTLETACDFDSAINTPAKKAPAATESHLCTYNSGRESWTCPPGTPDWIPDPKPN